MISKTSLFMSWMNHCKGHLAGGRVISNKSTLTGGSFLSITTQSIWYLRDQTWLCVHCWCQTPEGVVSPRRAITRAQPGASRHHTHTIMFDPDYNMMPPFFPQQAIFCSLKAVSSLSSREQSQSPLPCHRVIWVASIGVASTPGRENALASFCGRLGVWNRTATGVICFPWRQRSWSCGVFKSWISYAHCPFQWKWQVLYNYDISVLQ